jgi:phasin family protein
MANSRQEDTARNTVYEIGETTVEQTRLIGETAVEAGQKVAHASADLLQQNAKMLQNAFRFGPDLATTVMGCSTDQFNRALGSSSNDVQQATERSTRSAAAVIHSTSAVAKGMDGISREYLEFVRHQIESGMNRMHELWRCRTPQDVAKVQAEFLRESMETALQSSRRMADMSLKVVDDAGKQITQTTERRAA